MRPATFKKIFVEIQAGNLSLDDLEESTLHQYLSFPDLPEPDIFIRTGGESRISNYLLWQIAYTELYFTDTLWPDFNKQSLDDAFIAFAGRQRRFGHTGQQVIEQGIN